VSVFNVAADDVSVFLPVSCCDSGTGPLRAAAASGKPFSQDP